MNKQEYLIITFSDTTTAIYMERVCKEDGMDGRMIPLPREISAGCGLSWATVEKDRNRWATYLKEKNIEWLNVFSVDNVLQRINDPCFVGATILSGCDTGAKVVRKAAPDERVGVLCLEDGKPSIVEYYEMTDEMIHSKKENGDLLYNFGVTLNYLFKVSKLEEIMNNNMPAHVVEKKIPYVDDNGDTIKPETPNGYKFEQLVLDMIHMMDDCLSYEVVRCKEFAPIKNKEGVDSLETARILMKENGIDF